MHRGVQVTDTQEVVQHYSIRSEIAYQMQKKLKELAFDCEKALIEQDAKILGSMTDPREFGGLPYWIVTKPVSGGINSYRNNSRIICVDFLTYR